MKKRGKKSLFIKIFAVTCVLMVICCLTTYCFIAWLVPKTYSTELDDALDREVDTFLAELECTAGEESGILFDEFLLNNDVLLQLYDEDGREIALPSQHNTDFPGVVRDGIVFEGMPSAYGVTHSYLFRFSDSEMVYTLSAAGDAEPVNRLMDTIGNIVPPLMVMVVCISAIGAVLYSKYVTKPVIEISRVSEKMSDLDFSWDCTESRSDELGILAHSLNEMARKLSSALSELQAANSRLEADIERERMLEQAQLDFFSAVSHELKTPITVIKGQLEGMLLNVGKYKERDKYLARSLEVVKAMEGMVQEILTVSRIKSSETSPQEEIFDFSELSSRLRIYKENHLVFFENMNLKPAQMAMQNICLFDKYTHALSMVIFDDLIEVQALEQKIKNSSLKVGISTNNGGNIIKALDNQSERLLQFKKDLAL